MIARSPSRPSSKGPFWPARARSVKSSRQRVSLPLPGLGLELPAPLRSVGQRAEQFRGTAGGPTTEAAA